MARFCPSCGFDFTTLVVVAAEDRGDNGPVVPEAPGGQPIPLNAVLPMTPDQGPPFEAPIVAPIMAPRTARDRSLRTRPLGSMTSAAKPAGGQPAVPPVPRSPRYRAGQVLGTAILVVLVAVIAYVTFSTAARLGEPSPNGPSADASASHVASACELAVVDVLEHPERAISACNSQAEIDAAYRLVFLEPPNWGSELSDACAADPGLATRPLCLATAPPEPTPADSPASSAPSSSP